MLGPPGCQGLPRSKRGLLGLSLSPSHQALLFFLQGCRAMEPIVSSAKIMLESSAGLIQTARSLAVNPKDPPKWSVLAGHSRTVSDSIKKLITNMRWATPWRLVSATSARLTARHL